MEDLASDPAAEGDIPNNTGGAHYQGPSTPWWVKLFGTAVVALVLIFVALHRTGHGFSSHAPLAAAARQS